MEEVRVDSPYIDTETEEQVGGVTVQLVPTHPHKPTSVLWVLGKIETKPSNIKAFRNQPKPPAWSNPGGGMEEDELDRFMKRFSDHPMASLVNDTNFSLYDRFILCCGLREFIDETGYQDIRIYPYLPRYRYDWDDRDDNVSIYDFRHKNGHRNKTLFSHVESLDVRDIVEKEEIEKAVWFDISVPLARLFSDRIKFPLHPFYSHIRRLMITMRRVRRMSMFEDAPAYCQKECGQIFENIHPSLGLVFPVYAGEPEFPKKGFRLNRDNWYKLFYKMVADKIEYPSVDLIQRLFRAEIMEAKMREERREARGEDLSEPSLYSNEYTTGNHSGPDNLPVNELLKQDEEYARWLEEEIPQEQRIVAQ